MTTATALHLVNPGLRSVAICTQVLDCFAEHEVLGPTQVARELGVAKSTAYQMLGSLANGGLLERTEAGRYRLSLRLFDYGQLVLDRLPIRRIARPEIIALHEMVGHVVQLGLPANGYVVYVERFGHDPLRPQISGEWMRKVGGYASSAGRAMAAVDPVVERATFAVPMVRQTPHTVIDQGKLRQILAGTRARGWVRSVEESAPGFTSIAAPVRDGFGGAVAAVSVVGPTAKMTGFQAGSMVHSLLAAVGRISEQYQRHGAG
jgi:IclR family transcriptional regulator, KDG regulon repressor